MLKRNLFPVNFQEGIIVSDPPGEEKGFWSGAPSVLFDEKEDKFFLYYRLRSPKSRDYKGIIAESEDGFNYDKICEISKKQPRAHSLESSLGSGKR